MSRTTAGTFAWIALAAALSPFVGAQGAVVLGSGVGDDTTLQSPAQPGIDDPYSVSTGTSSRAYTQPLIADLPVRGARGGAPVVGAAPPMPSELRLPGAPNGTP
jgi:hypothetical protein